MAKSRLDREEKLAAERCVFDCYNILRRRIITTWTKQQQKLQQQQQQ